MAKRSTNDHDAANTPPPAADKRRGYCPLFPIISHVFYCIAVGAVFCVVNLCVYILVSIYLTRTGPQTLSALTLPRDFKAIFRWSIRFYLGGIVFGILLLLRKEALRRMDKK